MNARSPAAAWRGTRSSPAAEPAGSKSTRHEAAHVIFFNIIGAVMLAAAYATAKGAENWLGDPSEATFMLVMGSVAMTSDVTYRTLTSAGHWFAPSGGGSLMFLPVWAFGICWLGFAFAYHVLGFEKSTMLNVVVIGSVIAIMLVVAISKTPPPPPNGPG